ncbi:MAG: hypothetical protein HYX76_08170 [Acidobacteria bacterium]|nr:hypothetical protein [Acidobacteriota bacterium]
MHPLDVAILVGYLTGTVLLGIYFSRSQHSVNDYFVSGHAIPWWAITGSIVATETSTVTFVSVPGYAFGADLTFLQLVIGYLIGRLIVTVLFIPSYFRGELLTVYQLLGQRFGDEVKRFAAGLFLLTRSLADGFRLYLTGLVLSVLLLTSPVLRQSVTAWVPGGDATLAILIGSILVIGGATIIYTYLGGMSAVIWTDVVQLVVYLGGAGLAALILLDRIPGGWTEVVQAGGAAGKFRLIDPAWGWTRSYTLWSGVIGGAFLTTATHGTDQLIVQRYLCSASRRDASVALLASGVVVFVQFVLFLLIGIMLWVYYTMHAPAELSAVTIAGRVTTDRVFPQFIVTHLPRGVIGLVTAAVFAAAMSTLSSSLNSSSATAMADFYIPMTGGRRSERHYLTTSRLWTLAWGVVQIAVAMVAIQLSRRVVDEVLGIASFTNGIILGIFFLGTFTSRVGQRATFGGIGVGIITMLAVRAYGVSWQWYVLIGSVATFTAGLVADACLRSATER